jgi:dihydrolipoamide dehydrogenase
MYSRNKGVSVAGLDGAATSVDAKNILIATGSEVTPLPPVPMDNEGGIIVDSTGALEIKEVPKKVTQELGTQTDEE